MKPRQFLRKLQAAGVEIVPRRGKGSHLWAYYQGKWTVIPFHGSKDLGNDLMKDICKELGIDVQEVL